MSDAALKAVRYVLDRAQVDPDLGYYVGPGTQAFALLCAADAEARGVPLEIVERERGEDRQPAYRWREPDVERLRRERELLRAARDADELERIDAEVEQESHRVKQRALERRRGVERG